MLEKLGGRKLLASLLILIVGAATVAIKGDIPEHFLTLLEFVFGGYALGNVASKAVNVMTTKVASEPQKTQNPEALTGISDSIITVQKLLEFIIHRTGLDKSPPSPQNK